MTNRFHWSILLLTTVLTIVASVLGILVGKHVVVPAIYGGGLTFESNSHLRETAPKYIEVVQRNQVWQIVPEDGDDAGGPCLKLTFDAGGFDYQAICFGRGSIIVLPDGRPITGPTAAPQVRCMNHDNGMMGRCTNCSFEECLALTVAKREMTPEEQEMARKLGGVWDSVNAPSPVRGGASMCCLGTKPCWYAKSPDDCLREAAKH